MGDEPYLLADRETHFLQPTLARYLPREKKILLLENHGKWIGKDFVVQRESQAPFGLIFTPVPDLKVKSLNTE